MEPNPPSGEPKTLPGTPTHFVWPEPRVYAAEKPSSSYMTDRADESQALIFLPEYHRYILQRISKQKPYKTITRELSEDKAAFWVLEALAPFFPDFEKFIDLLVVATKEQKRQA